jgi:hypothetical protein
MNIYILYKQVWLKLALWLWRIRENCVTFTDRWTEIDRCQTTNLYQMMGYTKYEMLYAY